MLERPSVRSTLPPNYFDVSGDGIVSPQDVLAVIDALVTSGGGEAEPRERSEARNSYGSGHEAPSSREVEPRGTTWWETGATHNRPLSKDHELSDPASPEYGKELPKVRITAATGHEEESEWGTKARQAWSSIDEDHDWREDELDDILDTFWDA